MKVIKQSAELLYSNGAGEQVPYNIQVERAARTCYRSQDKITDGSSDKLLERLIKHNHYAMLEFGTVAMHVRSADLCRMLTDTIGTGSYPGVRKTAHIPIKNQNHEILSGNIRGIISTLVGAYSEAAYCSMDYIVITAALHELCTIPGVKRVVLAMRPDHEKEWADSRGSVGAKFRALNFLDVRAERNNMCEVERLAHTYATIRFITDRGVTHEMVRHRMCSFAQASTRYISYADGRMEVILPVWCHDNLVNPNVDEDEGVKGNLETFTEEIKVPIQDAIWLSSCCVTEDNYAMLMDGYNWSAQRARTVLNNSLATEIVVQANLEQWNHMLAQRSVGTTGTPHPQMQDLMRKAHVILRNNFRDDIIEIPADGFVLQENPSQLTL